MQIVIEIEEEDYNEVKEYGINNFPALAKAIQSGTPLPKGHGRLIDADVLIKHVEGLSKLPNGHSKQYDEAMIINIIDKNAETIIPADKEE